MRLSAALLFVAVATPALARQPATPQDASTGQQSAPSASPSAALAGVLAQNLSAALTENATLQERVRELEAKAAARARDTTGPVRTPDEDPATK